MEKKREVWIDNVKVIACILVLLGHLMQSMARSGIIWEYGWYAWFNQTVYFFHVPLFFICSGYLHQKLTRINNTGGDWGKNILRKFLNLGVPYVTFTTAVWLVKSIFSGAGSNEMGGLFETIFLQPTAPYWYLYCLFFIFLITGTFKTKGQALFGTIVALLMQVISVLGIGGGYCYAVSTVLANEIWFVLGMLLCFVDFPRKAERMSMFVCGGIVFLILSVLISEMDFEFRGMSFLMGLIACISVVGICVVLNNRRGPNLVITWLAKYTMPIFLMHSIFAAALRSVLLKMGIVSAWIQIPAGIVISITGPVVAANIMKKLKYPEFFLYPSKFIKIKLEQ